MSDFDRLMHDIEREARAEGPETVAQLRSLDSHFHIAGQLLALRRRRGITQRRLSELSGIQQADISRIERAETQPTTVTASRLAKALGADFGFYEIDTAGKTTPVEPASVKALTLPPVGERTPSLWRGAHKAGVLLQLPVSVAVARAPAGEGVDQWPHLPADDHLPHGRVQSSGPKSVPGAAEMKSSSGRPARPGR